METEDGQKNNLPSASGHRKGIETLIDIVKTAKNNSIKRLVVYAFSTETGAERILK